MAIWFRYPKTIGTGVGVLASIVLSSLKPGVGQKGLALILAGSVAAVSLLVVGLTAAVVAFRTRRRDLIPSLLLKRAIATRCGGFALAVFGCVVWAEYFATDDGLLRLAIGKTSGLVRPDPQPTFMENAWTQASFVLVNPEHLAVGIKADGSQSPPAYRLVAKAMDDDAKQAQKLSWNLKIPIIANDATLARRIFTETSLDTALGDEFGKEVHWLWNPKEFLPTKGTLAKFHDNRGRERIGHLLTDGRDQAAGRPQFRFVDLIPTAVDRSRTTIKRSDNVAVSSPFRIEEVQLKDGSTSPFDRLSDRDLREYADVLEYCLYNVLVKLQANQTRPIFLYVDDVIADVRSDEIGLPALKAALRASNAKLDAEVRAYFDGQARLTTIFEYLVQRIAEAEREKQKQNLKKDRFNQLTQEIEALSSAIAKLGTIIDQEKRLTSEVRGKLVRAGIPLVERSERALAVMRSKISGKSWLRPQADDEIESAIESKLVTASHILLTDIRTPDVSGRYQLSMRLVDVETGTIMWEDQGDRAPIASLAEEK